ncbi:Chaperone_J-domain superfamily [Hexamita inflata]|uniref:Chaperone J-domain superfamily n=1 Tax=Hexamita inflata TaxID=28002 RepID=A0AA86PVA4_9EUKA|nr:Chaperone J-domain superfamily [Hexamita inflata]
MRHFKFSSSLSSDIDIKKAYIRLAQQYNPNNPENVEKFSLIGSNYKYSYKSSCNGEGGALNDLIP